MKLRVLAAACFALSLMVAPSWAQITERDLLVAGRAVGFIQNLHTGDTNVGIVYLPGNAESVQEAHDIQSMLGSGLRVGNLVLKPILIPISQTGGADVSLFFLTDGVGAEASRVAAASSTRKIPCVTFDLAQVRAGTCAIGVRSQPRIEVIVNRAAAQRSDTRFAAMFRLMITEI